MSLCVACLRHNNLGSRLSLQPARPTYKVRRTNHNLNGVVHVQGNVRHQFPAWPSADGYRGVRVLRALDLSSCLVPAWFVSTITCPYYLTNPVNGRVQLACEVTAGIDSAVTV